MMSKDQPADGQRPSITFNGKPTPTPPPKKPGFWKSLSGALAELAGNILYQGPK